MKLKNRLLLLGALVTFSLNSLAGQPAARVGDMMSSGGIILGPGAPTVLIGGRSAARVTDMTINPLVNPGPVPCVGGPIFLGSNTVLIAGLGAARVGDPAASACGPHTIILGEPTVLIGG